MEPKFYVWMEPECGKFLYFGPFEEHFQAHLYSKGLGYDAGVQDPEEAPEGSVFSPEFGLRYFAEGCQEDQEILDYLHEKFPPLDGEEEEE